MITKDEYTIRTFGDIIQALKDHPEWLEELRRLILTEELLALPQRFERFLREEFAPLRGDVETLKGDVATLKQDVTTLKEDVETLKSDVATLKQDVATLKQDVAFLKQGVEKLKEEVKKLKDDVGELKGENFERRVRERAPAFFVRFIRRCRSVPLEELVLILEDALDQGKLTEEEFEELLNLDLVVTGLWKKDGRRVYLAVEAAYSADLHDAERAIRRAGFLSKVFSEEVIPVVVSKTYEEGFLRSVKELPVLVI